jgi:hypothetical protein
MINKINKERGGVQWTQPPQDTAIIASEKEPSWTQNKKQDRAQEYTEFSKNLITRKILSHCHTIMSSYCCIAVLSCLHIVALSYYHVFTLSHCRTIMSSHCRILVLSCPYTVALSYFHVFILSHCRTIMSSFVTLYCRTIMS